MADPINSPTNDIRKTLDERGSRYGKYSGHAQISQDIKNSMRNGRRWPDLTNVQIETLEMIAHKIGRILNGDQNYVDSWRDIVGYTQLVVDDLMQTVGATDCVTVPTVRTEEGWPKVSAVKILQLPTTVSEVKDTDKELR